MSVLDPFLSTWSNARSTFGDGPPLTGAQYDRSGKLTESQNNVNSAARWAVDRHGVQRLRRCEKFRITTTNTSRSMVIAENRRGCRQSQRSGWARAGESNNSYRHELFVHFVARPSRRGRTRNRIQHRSGRCQRRTWTVELGAPLRSFWPVIGY